MFCILYLWFTCELLVPPLSLNLSIFLRLIYFSFKWNCVCRWIIYLAVKWLQMDCNISRMFIDWWPRHPLVLAYNLNMWIKVNSIAENTAATIHVIFIVKWNLNSMGIARVILMNSVLSNACKSRRKPFCNLILRHDQRLTSANNVRYFVR